MPLNPTNQPTNPFNSKFFSMNKWNISILYNIPNKSHDVIKKKRWFTD